MERRKRGERLMPFVMEKTVKDRLQLDPGLDEEDNVHPASSSGGPGDDRDQGAAHNVRSIGRKAEHSSSSPYVHKSSPNAKKCTKCHSDQPFSQGVEAFTDEDREKNGVSWSGLNESHSTALGRRGRRLKGKQVAMPLQTIEGFTGDDDALERHLSTPGVAGFLEIEEEPTRQVMENNTTSYLPSDRDGNEVEDLLGLSYEPVTTSSGLLLTHRRTPPVSRRHQQRPLLTPDMDGDETRGRTFLRVPGVSVSPNSNSLEMDAGCGTNGNQEWKHIDSSYGSRGQSPGLMKAARILSFMQLWVLLFCVVLLVGTSVAIHSIRHERASSGAAIEQQNGSAQNAGNSNAQSGVVSNSVEHDQPVTKQVILLPHNNISELTAESKQSTRAKDSGQRRGRRVLRELRDEFDSWMKEHNKVYHSDDEKEKRFSIWSDNHHRTIEKNRKHGPCKVTKQAVFGSNHFKDLSPEEFQAKFLTGYNGPTTDRLEKQQQRMGQMERKKRLQQRIKENQPVRRTSKGSGHVLSSEDPLTAVDRHPDVQKRFLALWDPLNLEQQDTYVDPKFKASYGQCQWYNISCWLRWFFNTYGYGIGGVMRPNYDADSYPSAVDWTEMGVVTDIHSQGNCGACWAITAVETVESAYAMKKGSLLNLCETEVIACDDSCDMCEGGWPQNAYEYVMDHNGLPSEDYSSYDGDFLLALTYAKSGENDELDSDTVQSYLYETCPGGGGSHSGDGNYGGNDANRYGSIRGYGYATERCICYTDGTGCDCDDQNEAVAVRNVATYGPATVCLEASLWQDYAGGIMSADIGCSSAFLDMNHCVQVVGYAFVDVNEEEGEEQWNAEQGGGSGSGSNSHSGSGGSQDDGNREGYWIVRNQWSNGWGMNGYAYVAMGENTCGLLNDMTQVYM